MAEFRSRVILALLVAGLVGIALVNMVVDRRGLGEAGRELSWWSGLVLDVAVPVQKAVSVPFDFVRDSWRDYVSLLDVRDENDALRSRLASVEEENLQLREALVASSRLQSIVEMREGFEIPMLPAELVGIDVSSWFRSVLLDRGRSNGVRAGMPVISETGLVGLVTTTSRQAAKVMLLLDRQSAVDGVVQRSRARGIVRGARQDARGRRDRDVRTRGRVPEGPAGRRGRGGVRGGLAAAADRYGRAGRGLRQARTGLRDVAPGADHGAALRFGGRRRRRSRRGRDPVKRAAVLLGLGVLAPMLQGGLAPFVPQGLFPDLSLLLVVSIGLCWRSAVGGLLLAATIGFVCDLLSGALLGQHALLRVFAYGTARYASDQVNLRSPGAQMVFVAVLTGINALAMGSLTAFFSPGTAIGWIGFWELMLVTATNALTAPLMTAFVGMLVARLGDDEAGRRLLRLETRSIVS
jgi:rod shape-determining protein MreC